MTTISTLPVLPSTSTDSPSSYTTKADAFFAALPTLVTQVNAVNTEIENAATASDADVALVETYKNVTTSPSTSTTSSTSITPGASAKTFTIPSSTSFSVGMYVMVISRAAPSTNWMHGMITTHTTGGTTMTVTGDLTSNTVAEASDWTISLSGPLKFIDTNDTSSTTITPGIASKTLTVSSNKGFYPGMYVMIAQTGSESTNWMHGIVTSYSGTSLAVTGTSTSAIVASASSWKISMSAAPQATNCLGINQTWGDFYMAGGVVYQNTSARPIKVEMDVSATTSGSAGAIFYVGTTSTPTVIANQFLVPNAVQGYVFYVTAVIPPNNYYKVVFSGTATRYSSRMLG